MLCENNPQIEMSRFSTADARLSTTGEANSLPFTHADYPPLLAQIPAAPAALYVRGDTTALHRPQLALVGSRRPTAVGREIARDFARAFAAAGLGIASGAAERDALLCRGNPDSDSSSRSKRQRFA